MKLTLLAIGLFALVVLGSAGKLGHSKDVHIVEKINNANAGFKARHYKMYDGLSFEQLKARYGSPIKPEDGVHNLPPKVSKNDAGSVENFYIWWNWKQYASVFKTLQVQQEVCSSAWAMAVSSAYRDRRSIVHGITDAVSSWDILSCSPNSVDPTNGCKGGTHYDAFKYVTVNGTVTGGGFGSGTGCKSWPLDPNSQTPVESTKCEQTCDADYKKKSYNNDKFFGDTQTTISNDNLQVMSELLHNGSVVARFELFEDFLYYSNGVYEHLFGESLGYTYVRVVGWGVSKAGDNVPFWVAAFVNGANWGENGFFRIARGKTPGGECGFESAIVAGTIA